MLERGPVYCDKGRIMRAAGIMTSVHGQVLIRTAAVNASEQKEENLQSKGNISKLNHVPQFCISIWLLIISPAFWVQNALLFYYAQAIMSSRRFVWTTTGQDAKYHLEKKYPTTPSVALPSSSSGSCQTTEAGLQLQLRSEGKGASKDREEEGGDVTMAGQTNKPSSSSAWPGSCA